MVSVSAHTSIVFNGEIYNYRALRADLVREGAAFATESDTEVILEGYERHGTQFFDRMRGMWTFVIHDRRGNRLIAARDPFGIKPLNYALQNGSIYFASEINCLKEHLSLEPDPTAYALFYNLGYFLAPATPYRNVSKLRPGEVLTWDIQAKKFAAPLCISRFVEERAHISSCDEAINALDAAFEDSIEAHYVADVPVSILLSGGTDSSLIAAFSQKLGKRPDAYHVAIAGSEDTRYATSIATHLGIDLTVEELDQETLARQYEKVWEILDEPTGDISIIPTSLIFAKIKGKSKVVLSGEGGDELFGGYVRHSLFRRHQKVTGRNPADAFFNSLLFTNTSALSSWNPLVQRTRETFLRAALPDDLIGAYLRGARLIDYPIENKVDRNALFELYQSEAGEKIPPALAFDMIAYLPNDLLPKSDIASMASSMSYARKLVTA